MILRPPPSSTLFPYTTLFRSIRERIARYPTARVEYDHSSITYLPANEDGFVVRLSVEAQNDWEQYTVHYNGSHQELDRKSTRLNSSHVSISYAVFCLKKKNNH